MLAAIACTPVRAQQLSAAELLEMAGCIGYECLYERAVARGYEVKYNNETDAYKFYRFASKTIYLNQSNAQIHKPNLLELTLIKQDHSVSLNYVTGSDAERDSLLAQFRGEGFDYLKATKTKSTADNTAEEFVSEKYPKVKLTVTNFSRQKREGRDAVDEKTSYMEYGFQLQWLFVPPPSAPADSVRLVPSPGTPTDSIQQVTR